MAIATNNQQTPGNPVTGSMLDYILQAAQNPGQQQSQALQTIMQVPELADAYNKRNAYINGVQADMAKGIVNGPSNPINGDAVNPSDPASRFASLVPQTQAMTNNFLAGLLQQATSGTNNTQNNATSLINNAMSNQTQNRGLNLQYGESDPNSPLSSDASSSNSSGLPSMNGMDAVDYVKKNGGTDLLDGLSQPEMYKVAQSIVSSGGVGNYRKTSANPLSDSDRQEISGTNTTLQQLTRIQSRLKQSKTLQHALDNPVLNELVKVAISTGNQRMLGALGLSSSDVQALGDLTALNAQGDRQLIGGRLTGYLSNKLSPAMPGLDKSTKQNEQTLQVLQKNIMDSVKSYAKGRGYNYYTDIPGLDLGSFNLQAPNGQTYKGVSQNDVSEAIQNGYKEAQ